MGALGTMGKEGRRPQEPPHLGLRTTRLEISESPGPPLEEQAGSGRGVAAGWPVSQLSLSRRDPEGRFLEQERGEAGEDSGFSQSWWPPAQEDGTAGCSCSWTVDRDQSIQLERERGREKWIVSNR